MANLLSIPPELRNHIALFDNQKKSTLDSSEMKRMISEVIALRNISRLFRQEINPIEIITKRIRRYNNVTYLALRLHGFVITKFSDHKPLFLGQFSSYEMQEVDKNEITKWSLASAKFPEFRELTRCILPYRIQENQNSDDYISIDLRTLPSCREFVIPNYDNFKLNTIRLPNTVFSLVLSNVTMDLNNLVFTGGSQVDLTIEAPSVNFELTTASAARFRTVKVDLSKFQYTEKPALSQIILTLTKCDKIDEVIFPEELESDEPLVLDLTDFETKGIKTISFSETKKVKNVRVELPHNRSIRVIPPKNEVQFVFPQQVDHFEWPVELNPPSVFLNFTQSTCSIETFRVIVERFNTISKIVYPKKLMNDSELIDLSSLKTRELYIKSLPASEKKFRFSLQEGLKVILVSPNKELSYFVSKDSGDCDLIVNSPGKNFSFSSELASRFRSVTVDLSKYSSKPCLDSILKTLQACARIDTLILPEELDQEFIFHFDLSFLDTKGLKEISFKETSIIKNVQLSLPQIENLRIVPPSNTFQIFYKNLQFFNLPPMISSSPVFLNFGGIDIDYARFLETLSQFSTIKFLTLPASFINPPGTIDLTPLSQKGIIYIDATKIRTFSKRIISPVQIEFPEWDFENSFNEIGRMRFT